VRSTEVFVQHLKNEICFHLTGRFDDLQSIATRPSQVTANQHSTVSTERPKSQDCTSGAH